MILHKLVYGLSGDVINFIDSFIIQHDHFLLSPGADRVMDYTREDFTRKGQCYDLILDVVTLPSLFHCRRTLCPGGLNVMLGGGSYKRALQCIFLGPLMTMVEKLITGSKGGNMGIPLHKPNRKDLNALTEFFMARTVVTVFDRRFKLSEVKDAFLYFGSGMVQGKLDMLVDDPMV